MTTVDLRDLGALQRALVALAQRIEQSVTRASWVAADWGLSRAVSTTAAKGISASNTFKSAWISRRLKDGALVGNSAEHAVWVERGRKPGRPPPAGAILRWLEMKRIRAKDAPVLPTGEVTGGRQRRRIRKLRKTSRAAAQRRAQLSLALGIARKIGKRGLAGRWILRDLYPKIGARWYRQIRVELDKLSRDPPRG